MLGKGLDQRPPGVPSHLNCTLILLPTPSPLQEAAVDVGEDGGRGSCEGSKTPHCGTGGSGRDGLHCPKTTKDCGRSLCSYFSSSLLVGTTDKLHDLGLH